MIAMADIEDAQQIFTPSEAVAYLERRGIKMSVAALRMRRMREKKHSGKELVNRRYGRITLWTKAELDTIRPPQRGKKLDETPNQPEQEK